METYTTAAKPISDAFFLGLIVHLSSLKMPLQKQLNIQLAEKIFSASWLFVVRTVTVRYYIGLTDDLR